MKNGLIVSLLLGNLLIATGNSQEFREHENILQNFDNVDSSIILMVVRQSLQSENILRRDAGCIVLHHMFDRMKRGDRKADMIFRQLSTDRIILNVTAGIVDSKLLGWYNRNSPETAEDDFALYKPLFYLLGKSDTKTARGTLARAMLYLDGQKRIFEDVPISEELIDVLLKKLRVIDDKLCCLYPGKEIVVDMLEKDLRYSMLQAFDEVISRKEQIGEKIKGTIKTFIIECMNYGDINNGYLIRMQAVDIAEKLLDNGDYDLVPYIDTLSTKDPYFVHTYSSTSGFSFTELRYPVREKSASVCSKHRKKTWYRSTSASHCTF